MTDEYINKINNKKIKSKIRQSAMFGQGLGCSLMIVFFLRYLESRNIMQERVAISLFLLGAGLLTIGIVCPYILYYPSKALNELINEIFKVIFKVILTIIYVVLVIPIGLVSKKKWSKEYGFFVWNDKEEIKDDYGFKEKANISNNKRNKGLGRLGTIVSTIQFFIQSGEFTLIPILFILLFVGLLFFFITSGVVTPMIYTLF